ncbi:MAG: hypothetical protein F4203_04120 [Rhodobacteraceae bacterium]|nr:hypothetical protein [Paracoccaceae bacterium]MYG42318.1 hypothetical protein [Paracoccaceae bacterium]
MSGDKGKHSANFIQDCIFLATDMIPDCSCQAGYLPEAFPIRINLPEPFPGCCLPNSKREEEIPLQPVKQSSPEDPAISMVSAGNHASNIVLSPLPETAIELVMDFNPYHLDLPAGLNREWWT